VIQLGAVPVLTGAQFFKAAFKILAFLVVDAVFQIIVQFVLRVKR